MSRAVRQRGVALTDRQRQVLELIERGQTNYEIAQALGVSLEGAKYHVREVMTKLGADSREEAVRFWRETQQPRRSVRALLVLLWPRAAVAAGGVGIVVAAAFLALALFGQDDDETGEQVLVAYTEERSAGTASLVVVDGRGKEVHRAQITGGLPRWSPDGSLLAWLGLDGDTAIVQILEGDTWSASTYTLPELPYWFVWSPNSQLLAVAVTGRVVLLDRDGREVATSAAFSPRRDVSPFSGMSWASNSERVAATLYGTLVVTSISGETVVLERPEAADADLVAMRWLSGDELLVVDRMAPRDSDRAFLVNFSDPANPVWTPTQPVFPTPVGSEAFEERLRRDFPEFDVGRAEATADGQGLLAVLTGRERRENELPQRRLAVMASDVITVSISPGHPDLGRTNLDAVVIR